MTKIEYLMNYMTDLFMRYRIAQAIEGYVIYTIPSYKGLQLIFESHMLRYHNLFPIDHTYRETTNTIGQSIKSFYS